MISIAQRFLFFCHALTVLTIVIISGCIIISTLKKILPGTLLEGLTAHSVEAIEDSLTDAGLLTLTTIAPTIPAYYQTLNYPCVLLYMPSKRD